GLGLGAWGLLRKHSLLKAGPERGITLFSNPCQQLNLAILNPDQAMLENDFQLASLHLDILRDPNVSRYGYASTRKPPHLKPSTPCSSRC
ncbi:MULTISPECIES: hypothetical protein, partial [unclassified Pseudomonas]|uniref:hypothetical protein n=1 Tax=unclassified Pseudomonas TaxID=196821 RepID=UPI001C4478C0